MTPKLVILAGGRGSRLGPETELRPKPMVEIGDRPILWHVMKIYESHGVSEFVVCLGYLGHRIKEYFANYSLHTSDVTVDLGTGKTEIHGGGRERWRVTLVDTGADTMTGGRLLRVRHQLKEGTFFLTYGDGLANVNIAALLAFHRRHGRAVTVTAVRPPGRFGVLELDGDRVTKFAEKPSADGGWINGGFFVCESRALDTIAGDATFWEGEPLAELAAAGELAAFRHEGFWHPMDTPHDRDHLEALWREGNAPWKVWR